MRRPISLKIFSITTALLALMVIVTWLSVFNFRLLNNQVQALADYYLPLQEQVASVEILVRQQIVHMERVVAGMQSAKPDAEFLAKESGNFDNRGVNADQIVDSSLRLLAEADAARDIELDRVTLAVLGRQLPAIQTARQRFHAAFRTYQIEAEEGNRRSEKVVREALSHEKDNLDVEIQKVIDLLNKLTQDTAQQAKAEEARATRLNWIVTGIATVLGLIFAFLVTRSLVEPIKRLLGGTQAVEKGDLGVEILVHTRDEIAVLADSFNHMVVGLREKEHIRETFGQYVDPRIVRGLLENRLPAEGGQRRVMSVFFSDLADFARMCECLTPDASVRFLNRYFSLMAEVIRSRQGIIDKFIGDSVMAFWGAPFTEETGHAELCCAAALDQMAQFEAFRADLPNLLGVRFGLPKVDIRMGIASGEVTVGNKFYGTRILVSAETRHLAGESLAFREIDTLRVIGKIEPIRVYELLGYHVDSTAAELITLFETGLAHYRKQDWDAAETAFNACLKLFPEDRPSAVFLDRIRTFRQSPLSPDWDGVWIALSK